MIPAIFGFLFGRKPKVDIETRSTLSPAQQHIANFLTGPIAGGVSNPPNLDPDAFQSATPGLNASLDSLSNLSDLALQNFFGVQSVAGDIGSGPTATDIFGGSGGLNFNQGANTDFLVDVFNRGPTDFQDFFNTNVRDPLLDQFQDIILPGISRRQGLEGFSTSGRVDQDRRATDAILRELTRSQADLAFRTTEADNQRDAQIAASIAEATGADASRVLQAILSDDALRAQLATGDADRALTGALGAGDLTNQALNAISNALGAQLAGAQVAGQFGQQDADRALQVALANAGFSDQAIARALQFLATPQIENIVKNFPGTTGLIPSILGSEAGSAALVSAIASDIRLKENLVQIGEVKGIPFYTFDWNEKAASVYGLSGKGLGVTAQEARAYSPEAVVEDPETGYLQVMYGAL